MQVRFWGTRGSLAKPGPSTIRYGGNTSCVEVRAADGTLIILDCGTGAHDLGQTLLRDASGPVNGSLLISHTHWDHIQGIPFFAPFFVPGNEWDIYAPQGFGETLRTTLAGQMEYTYFPITAESFGASLRYHNLSEGEFRIGDVRIVTRYLNHPALTIGYRIEADGAAIVYACDHEPHSSCAATSSGTLEGQDLLHSEFLRDADLVIHDAQYTADEYSTKAGWGHSTVHYAVNVCARTGVRTLAFTHHDPMRSDDQVDRLLSEAKSLVGGANLDIVAASEGLVLELIGTSKVPIAKAAGVAEKPTATSDCLLLVTSDATLSGRVMAVANDEHLTVIHMASAPEPLSMLDGNLPSLVIIDGNLPLGMIEAIAEHRLPTIILGGGALASATDTVE